MNKPLDLPATSAHACERLALSRERIRKVLVAAAAPSADTGSAKTRSGPLAALLHQLNSVPGAKMVLELLQGWWRRHPLHSAGSVAADAAKAMVGPLTQRHPLGVVAGAAVLGGLLVWSRPWRWLLKPALLAGLLPQLISGTLAQLAEVKLESWLAMMASLAPKAAPAAPAGQAASAEPAAPPA